jgi:hypothetical protein
LRSDTNEAYTRLNGNIFLVLRSKEIILEPEGADLYMMLKVDRNLHVDIFRQKRKEIIKRMFIFLSVGI